LTAYWQTRCARWRDIFDIYWVRERGVRLNRDYLTEEFGSYVERLENLVGVARFLRSVLERGDFTGVERESSVLLHRSLLSRSLVELYLKSAARVLGERTTRLFERQDDRKDTATPRAGNSCASSIPAERE
jgi:hypothetical protein